MAYITAEEAVKLLEKIKEQYNVERFQFYKDWISLNESKINKEIETACANRKNYFYFSCPTSIFQFVRPFFSNLGYKVTTVMESPTTDETNFNVTWSAEKED